MSSKRRDENPSDSWTAPEHSSSRRYMVKDLNRDLIIDHRPEAMKPRGVHPLDTLEYLQWVKNGRIRQDRVLRRQGKL